jgi:AIPR protein
MNGEDELGTFCNGLHQEVRGQLDLLGSASLPRDAFTELMVSYLADAGEFDDAFVVHHRSRGEEVDGYSLSDQGDRLDLLISIYRGAIPPETITKSDVDTSFKRLLGFLGRAIEGRCDGVEGICPVRDMILSIHDHRKSLDKIRLFLLTDGMTTVTHRPAEDLEGKDVSYHIWDMRRLFRCVSSGQRREPIEIDFRRGFGASIPCLPVPGSSEDYKAYLAIFSGDVLARLYDEYGPRLLERNVRSFLQARGKVNRGIQKTIQEAPQRFLAYNNGISLTAAEIRLETCKDGTQGIVWARDLQIVNGGQTTASIHHAFKKDRADVAAISVQAKLSVIDSSRLDELVPLISRFANSQNKVNEADFFANDPFHVRLEELSRTVWAPASSGMQRQTKWYYERARGQFQDARGREPTPAKKREFLFIHPQAQKFTKTDLAKFENTWTQLPHKVSLGAEKNFREFSTRIAENRQGEPDQPYFERLIAKAILFRKTEKIVHAQQFGGYRANIVTFTLALIFHRTSQRIDLDRIWREQDIAPVLAETIQTASRLVHACIISPPAGRNVTEWCKKEECWDRVKGIELELPQAMVNELILIERVSPAAADGHVGQREETTSGVPGEVTSVPAETWFKISRWARETGNLQNWQRSLAYSLGRIASQGGVPSTKQAAHAVNIIEEVRRLGYPV